MIADVHAHIMSFDWRADIDRLLKIADRYGVNRYYFSCLDGSAHPDEENVAQGNAIAASCVKEYPGLFRGYVHANPRNRDALDVVKKGMEEQGLSGLKLLISVYCNDPLVYPLVEKMIEYDRPILIHSFVKAVGQLDYESTAVHIADLAKRYPEAKIIMAHLGGEPHHAIRHIAPYQNVWVDHSGTLVGSNDLNHTVNLIGADRILFGSDIPIAFASSYGQVLEAQITEEEKQKILWKNTIELFGEAI